MFMPQHYEFTPGRSYILFAKKTDSPALFSQLWMNHTSKSDQGLLLAANDLPLRARSVKEACWLNLLELQVSANAEDVVYALRQLDQMSGDKSSEWFMDLKDFPREDVVELVRPLLATQNAKTLAAAIEVAGSRNPHTSTDAQFWLVTVGKGHLPGFAARDPKVTNLAGRLLWRELTAVADSRAPANLRASAVRALGRSAVPELPTLLQQWARDDQPLIREAALVLLADFPGETSQHLIQNAAADHAAEVRQGAAQAIGFGQFTSLVSLLDKLLKDDSFAVRQAAAMSLLSFSLAASGEVLRQNIRDTEYHTLFVNALAASDAAPYLTNLQGIILKNLEPAHFWGGRIPAVDSWDILFKYLQSRPPEELQSGKLDTSLDALEKLKWYGSSEPRDLYALYLQRGLTRRARAFREQCSRTFTYDINYYFRMVDRSPDTYKRE